MATQENTLKGKTRTTNLALRGRHAPEGRFCEVLLFPVGENTDPVSMISRWVAMTRKYRMRQAAKNERADLIAWARQQMAQHAVKSGSSQDDDIFLGNMDISTYFALPDAERERIWAEMYSTGIESAPISNLQSLFF